MGSDLTSRMKHHCHCKRYKTNQSPERIKRKALDLQRNEEKGNWVSLITPNQEIEKYTSAEQPRTSRKMILSRPFIPLQSSTYLVSSDIACLLYTETQTPLFVCRIVKFLRICRIENWRSCQMETRDTRRKKYFLGFSVFLTSRVRCVLM